MSQPSGRRGRKAPSLSQTMSRRLIKVSPVAAYGVAIAAAAVATLVRLALEPLWGSRLPFIFFFPAIMLSSWFGGAWPGILTTALAALAAGYFWLEPAHAWAIADTSDLVGLLVFAGVGAVISILNEAWRRGTSAVIESDERLRVTLTSIGDAVIATDAQGRVTRLNPVAEQLTGWEMADALGRPLEEVFVIINEHTRQPAENPVYKVLHEGTIAGLANHTVLLAKDGREIPIDDSAAPIRTNGAIVGVVMVFRDITERRSAEQERAALLEKEQAARAEAERQAAELRDREARLAQMLERLEETTVALHRSNEALEREAVERERVQQSLRESEARLSAFLEQLPLGVGMVDAEGRWVIRNRALDRFVHEFIPSHDPDATPRWRTWAPDGSLVDPSEWPGARALREELVAPGMDFLYTPQDGMEIWTHISAAPFRDQAGEIVGAIVLIEDIDERKRATARLEAVGRITQALLRHTVLDDVLRELLAQVRTALGVDEATILFDWEEDEAVVVRASLGIEEAAARRYRVPFGQGVAGRVAATRQAVIIPDLSKVDVVNPYLRQSVRSLVAVPILVDNEVVGVLHAGTAIPRNFTQEDRAFLELMAERTASIIERARLHDAERAARVEAEAARVEAENASEQLRLALEAGRMGTWEYALGSGTVKWSPGLEAIHGFAPGSFPGTIEAFREEIHPDDRARILEAIQTAVAQRRDHHVEYRIVRSDGAVRWVEGRGRLLCDDQGRPERMAGVCLDVTERKQAEERFRLAVEAAPAAIIMVDAQGAIVLANSLAEHLFGYSRQELVGAPIDRLVPPRFRHGHPHYRGGYFADPSPRPMGAGRDLYALRKDGSEVPVEIGLSPLQTADGPFVLAAITDITERVRLHDAERAARAEAEAARQKAESANRARADFLAVVSHDLRTPLNAIGGYAQILEMEVHGRLSEEQRSAVTRIDQNQRGLLHLLDELLSFARVEAGRVDYRLEDVALDPLLSSLEGTIAPQVQQKGLVYAYRPCDGSLTVHADREKLEQVLLNLLTNAVKFTDSGGRITLEVEAGEDRAAVHVRDTGRGIPADRLASVFEPFVQVGRRTDRKEGGVGLGLAIGREFARGMGGDLTAESVPGQGSTFTLQLPRHRSTDPSPASATPARD